MKITDVQVFPVPEAGKLLAFARICLDDELQLTSLRVYQGTKDLFVSYPNDPNYKGDDYKQIFYPVNRSFRTLMEKAVLDAFMEEVDYENYATAVAETKEY